MRTDVSVDAPRPRLAREIALLGETDRANSAVFHVRRE